eukprot:6844932-Pyramimonas_sp.AAC.1
MAPQTHKKEHSVCILVTSVRQNKCTHHRSQTMPAQSSHDTDKTPHRDRGDLHVFANGHPVRPHDADGPRG